MLRTILKETAWEKKPANNRLFLSAVFHPCQQDKLTDHTAGHVQFLGRILPEKHFPDEFEKEVDVNE